MTDISNDLIWRKPRNLTAGPSYGGRMGPTQIQSLVRGNLFPDVLEGQRQLGMTDYAKAFLHVASDDDLGLINPRIFVDTPTPGQDRILFFSGTQTDTLSNLTGSERLYGGGFLNADVVAGASTITVLVEASGDNIFRSGDTIRISNKSNPMSVAGTRDIGTISGTPSYVGNVATITLASPIQNSYLASNTRVAPCFCPDTIVGSVSGWSLTSAAGTYNNTTYPFLVDSIGGVEHTVTLTFLTTTTFSGVSDLVGSLGIGNVSSDYYPTNPDFSKPYGVLRAAGFGGTFAPGDVISFVAHPASVGLWFKRVVPTGCPSLAGNVIYLGYEGESQ